MGVTNSSHEQFIQMVNAGHTEVEKATVKLAETLATYGFRGRLDLKLDVQIKGDLYEDSQHRASTLTFKR